MVPLQKGKKIMKTIMLFFLTSIPVICLAMEPVKPLSLVTSAAIGLGVGLGSIYLHELGHKVTLKSLMNIDSTIQMLPPACIPKSPINYDDWRTAAVAAAGPLVGIASSLLLLKLSNIVFTWSTSSTFYQALTGALKLPLVHPAQGRSMQLISGLAIITDGCALIPLTFLGTPTDGLLIKRVVTNVIQKKRSKNS